MDFETLHQSHVSRCDDSREASLFLSRDVTPAWSCASIGEDGYAVFGGVWGRGVTFIDPEGRIFQDLPPPAAGVGDLTDLARLPDGSFLLSGTRSGFSGSVGWAGKLDANWNLLWQADVGADGAGNVFLAALPDGGAIVAGATWMYGLNGEPDASFQPEVFWTRLDADGQVLWERREAFDSIDGDPQRARVVALTSESSVKLVVQSKDGLVMIRGDLDGASETMLLDTQQALILEDIVALPEERLAIASTRAPGAVLTVVAPDGTVEWEKTFDYETGAEATAIAYDAVADEVVLAGSHRGSDGGQSRTWMVATDRQGNQIWKMTRGPEHVDGDRVEGISPDKGPDINDVAVGPDGRIFALAYMAEDIEYFVIEPNACE